jgi:hypothetical protein
MLKKIVQKRTVLVLELLRSVNSTEVVPGPTPLMEVSTTVNASPFPDGVAVMVDVPLRIATGAEPRSRAVRVFCYR